MYPIFSFCLVLCWSSKLLYQSKLQRGTTSGYTQLKTETTTFELYLYGFEGQSLDLQNHESMLVDYIEGVHSNSATDLACDLVEHHFSLICAMFKHTMHTYPIRNEYNVVIFDRRLQLLSIVSHDSGCRLGCKGCLSLLMQHPP